jgi:acyl-CoA reductase-like NAD-dependent aldehyde dehydrogenase
MTDRPALPPLLDYVDGEHIEPQALDRWLEDPNTGERIQPQVRSRDDVVERALARAWQAHVDEEWAGLPAPERATLLEAMADALEPRAAQAAQLESLTTGVTIRMTSMLTVILTGAFRMAAQQLREGLLTRTLQGMAGQPVEVSKHPWGPALLLVPWNAPAPMAAHKLASALAAGAPAILKPTELAPNACGLLADAARAAGLPAGAFQLVHGDREVGGRLVTDPRVRAVSFTGGLAGGRAIAAACAADLKPAQLELGGNNPVVVLPDADLERAAKGIVDLLTQLNGQWCRALGWLVAHESQVDDLLALVLDELAGLRLGSSLDPSSDMGPIIGSGHLAALRGQLEGLVEAGGKAHATTPLPDLPGSFLAPTLVTGAPPDACQDEIFGPIGSVHGYADEQEALALANGTPYGLEAYVFAGDAERATAFGRRIRAGGVKINGSTVMSLSLMAPRPAWGLSGIAPEGTVETIEFFCGDRVVGVEGILAAEVPTS